MFPTTTNILLIDDMKGVRVLVSKILKELGYQNIKEANNGKEGLDVLKSLYGKTDSIELVIADLRMPVMDGMELLKIVRNTSEFKNLPYVILTAESEKSNVVTAVKLGVNDYLIKPITAIQLSRKLEAIWFAIQKQKAG